MSDEANDFGGFSSPNTHRRVHKSSNRYSVTGTGGFDLIQTLRRNIELVLIVLVVGMAATHFWMSRQAPIFAADAAIVIQSAERPTDTAQTSNRTNATPGSSMVFTEVEVMRSRQFAMSLVEELGLKADPRFNPALAPFEAPTLVQRVLAAVGLREITDWRTANERAQTTAVLEKLMSTYTIEASPQHSVIDIEARHSDPELAARIANAIAEIYVAQTLRKELARLDRGISFLSKRSAELSEDLTRRQVEMTGLIQENDLRATEQVRSMLAERKRLANVLEATAPGTAEYDRIATQIEDLTTILNERVSAEIKLAEMELALQTDLTRYDRVNEELGELEALRNAASANVRQISVAEVPHEAIGPNAPATYAVALLVLGFLGSVGAMLREALDRRVRGPIAVEQATGLPVVASIPQIPTARLREHGAPHNCLQSGDCPAYTNAILSLVTTVTAETEPRRAPFVFVGSSFSGEGKSTLVSSLAVAAALDDLRVLVVDADVYCARVSALFGVKRGDFTFGEAFGSLRRLKGAIKHTNRARVDLLNFVSGSRLSRHAFNSDDTAEIIEHLRNNYDLVLFDSAPYLTSEDSNRLSKFVDVGVLVCSWGQSGLDALSETAHRMESNGLNVIGIAINGISASKALSDGYMTCNDRDYYYVPENQQAN